MIGDRGVLDVAAVATDLLGEPLPSDMLDLIDLGEPALATARRAVVAASGPSTGADLWQPIERVAVIAPIPRPRKNVFCVGRNYRLHILEGARARGVEPKLPEVPEFFSKPPTTVIGHDEEITWKDWVTQQLDYEVELAVIVGRRSVDLQPEHALDAVFGYTIVNDVSARDLQKAHGQWFKGKGLDTSCPMGPVITTADEFGDPSGHRVTLRVNGKTRQNSNTADMLFSVGRILASLSSGLTLEPGDVVATGTPSGVALGMEPQRWLEDGDVVEAEIEGIGTLRNRVVRRRKVSALD